MESEGTRRRSTRKREGKSYAELGETDFFLDDENSVPTSPLKGANSGGATSVASVIRQANNHHSTPLSNGDIEMESEDDDDSPLEPLPLPKVSQWFFFNLKIGRILRKDFLSIWMIHQESKKTLVAAFSLCLWWLIMYEKRQKRKQDECAMKKHKCRIYENCICWTQI